VTGRASDRVVLPGHSNGLVEVEADGIAGTVTILADDPVG